MIRNDDWISKLYLLETMKQVRAKFKVIGKERYGMNGHKIELWPAYGDSDENKEFFKTTPSGQIILQTVNDSAADQFLVGYEYYVDFTEVNK